MVKHFKSKEDYRKYIAFIKMHDIKTTHPETVIIAGVKHKIDSDRKKSKKVKRK